MSSPDLNRQKPPEWDEFTTRIAPGFTSLEPAQNVKDAQDLAKALYELPPATLAQMGDYILGIGVDHITNSLQSERQRRLIGAGIASLPGFHTFTSEDYISGNFHLQGAVNAFRWVLVDAESNLAANNRILSDAITTIRWHGPRRTEQNKLQLAAEDILRDSTSITQSALGGIVAKGSVRMLMIAAQKMELSDPWDIEQKEALFAKARTVTDPHHTPFPSLVEIIQMSPGDLPPERQEQVNFVLDATWQGFHLGRA